MQSIRVFLWAMPAALTALWLAVEPGVFQTANFFALRAAMVQYSGILAIGCMSVAMILAVRPRWPERWFGGLDKMYRLHKWLGIGALLCSVGHWLWVEAPRWAIGLGWLTRPPRGPRPMPNGLVEHLVSGLRHPAESVGEWAFYAAVLLIVLTLVRVFPYRLFFKSHRLMAVAYLALAFHSVVLTKSAYWASPMGAVLALMLALGSWAAVLVLTRRAGADRRVQGRIVDLHFYPVMRSLEIRIELPPGWQGHKAGQFAFVRLDPAEEPHPFTMISAWDPAERRVSFLVKELGDHTGRLREKLRIGQPVTVEGPYGCFAFGDDRPVQIWVGGGIGVTPFIARMRQLATAADRPLQKVHLFHTTPEYDSDLIARLTADSEAAGVDLHVLVDSRDGFLTGERIREAVPEWRRAGIWFCGPAGFGHALREDFAAHGLPVNRRFHQELFAMR